jgi:ABC-2 type transport system permease protein
MMVRHLPGLFLAEFQRYLRVWWSYRANALSWIVLWAVAFPLLMATFDSVAGGYGVEQRQASLLGFLVWDWSMAILGAATGFVSAEAREGTLESVVLSPVAPLITFTLRIVATFVILGAQTLFLGTVLALLLRIPPAFTGSSIVIVLMTLVGVGGLSLALGGLALLYKSTGNVVGVFSLLALVLTGALVPLNRLGILYEVLKYVTPTTWGIDVLRETVIGGASWGGLWRDGVWTGLGIQTIVFVALGAFVFDFCFKRARERGMLASY